MNGGGQTLLIIGLNALCAQTAFTWTLCYYASEMTWNFKLFAWETYKSAWYTFPIAEQRIIDQMLMFGQQEVQFTGFNIVDCSVQTFASVCFFFLPLKRN